MSRISYHGTAWSVARRVRPDRSDTEIIDDARDQLLELRRRFKAGEHASMRYDGLHLGYLLGYWPAHAGAWGTVAARLRQTVRRAARDCRPLVVCALASGPAPELFGVAAYANSVGIEQLDFVGVDIDQGWEPMQRAVADEARSVLGLGVLSTFHEVDLLGDTQVALEVAARADVVLLSNFLNEAPAIACGRSTLIADVVGALRSDAELQMMDLAKYDETVSGVEVVRHAGASRARDIDDRKLHFDGRDDVVPVVLNGLFDEELRRRNRLQVHVASARPLA